MDPFQVILPISEREAAILGVLALFVTLVVLVRAAMSTGQVKPFSETWYLAAIGLLAVILAPVWLALIGFAIWSLVELAASFPEFTRTPDGSNATDIRWHVLAFAGLGAVPGGLIGAPLALIRIFTTEQQTV